MLLSLAEVCFCCAKLFCFLSTRAKLEAKTKNSSPTICHFTYSNLPVLDRSLVLSHTDNYDESSSSASERLCSPLYFTLLSHMLARFTNQELRREKKRIANKWLHNGCAEKISEQPNKGLLREVSCLSSQRGDTQE